MADDYATTSPGTFWDARPYHGQEFSVDMFGADVVHSDRDQFDSFRRDYHDQAAGGVGLNYFITRYLGVGADTFTEGREPFIYSASGNVIGRFPIIDTGIAPYVFGGAGGQFDYVREGFGQGGGGVEFRLANHVGLFVDGRYVIPRDTHNYGVLRAGLRFSF